MLNTITIHIAVDIISTYIRWYVVHPLSQMFLLLTKPCGINDDPETVTL